MIERCYDCGGTVDECDCEEFIVCECVRVDVDEDDASDCPAHGPNSKQYRKQLEREAEAEAAWWRGMGPF